MHPFPVALELAGRDVLVIGSDDDAVRRVEKLVAAGARVRVLVRGEVPESRSSKKRGVWSRTSTG